MNTGMEAVNADTDPKPNVFCQDILAPEHRDHLPYSLIRMHHSQLWFTTLQEKISCS